MREERMKGRGNHGANMQQLTAAWLLKICMGYCFVVDGRKRVRGLRNGGLSAPSHRFLRLTG